MERFKIVLLGKASGEVIPRGMHNKIAAYVRKKCERGETLDSLKLLILQVFERNDITGSLTIVKDGKHYLKVGSNN